MLGERLVGVPCDDVPPGVLEQSDHAIFPRADARLEPRGGRAEVGELPAVAESDASEVADVRGTGAGDEDDSTRGRINPSTGNRHAITGTCQLGLMQLDHLVSHTLNPGRLCAKGCLSGDGRLVLGRRPPSYRGAQQTARGFVPPVVDSSAHRNRDRPVTLCRLCRRCPRTLPQKA